MASDLAILSRENAVSPFENGIPPPTYTGGGPKQSFSQQLMQWCGTSSDANANAPGGILRAASGPGSTVNINPEAVHRVNAQPPGSGVTPYNQLANTFGGADTVGDARMKGNGINPGHSYFEPSYATIKQDASTYVGATISHLVWSGDSFYASDSGESLLPFEATESDSITFDTYFFRPQLLPRTAELVPTRYLGYEKISHQYAFNRYGIGIKATADVLNDPEGRRIFSEQIVQVKESIDETIKFGVIYAIITSDHVTAQYMRQLNAQPSPETWRIIYNNQIMRWNACKEPRGIQKLVAYANEDQGSIGGSSDTLLVHPMSAIHQQLELNSNADADKAGDVAAQRARYDPLGSFATGVDGHKVRYVRGMQIDDRAPRNPLQFYSQIGEHYFAFNHMHGTSHLGDIVDPAGDVGKTGYVSKCSALRVYNESANVWEVVMPSEYFMHASLFRANGDPMPPPNFRRRNGDTDHMGFHYNGRTGVPFTTFGEMLYLDSEAGGSVDNDMDTMRVHIAETLQNAGDRWFNMITGGAIQANLNTPISAGMQGSLTDGQRATLNNFATIRFNKANTQALLRLNVLLPIAVVAKKSFMEYGALAMIKIKAGIETGRTYMKKALFTFGQDPTIQEDAGSLTFKSRSVVTKPENVQIINDVDINDYVGGNNMVPIENGEGTPFAPARGLYGSKHNTGDETGFAPSTRERPSVLYMAVPYRYIHGTRTPPTMLSLLPVANGDNLVIPTLPFYEAIFQFQRNLAPTAYNFHPDYVNDRVYANHVTFRGKQYSWNKFKNGGEWEVTGENSGHWKDTYVGCGPERIGMRAPRN